MTTPMRYLVLAATLCCVATTALAQVTRDSAGVRIVESAAPVWAPGQEWRLSDAPILSLGADSGSGKIGHIAGAARLTDGHIVVADQEPSLLRVYDGLGRQLNTVPITPLGKRGYRSFYRISRLAGDSIGVEAPTMMRILSPDGAFVRDVEYGPFPQGAVQSPLLTMGRLHDGSALVMDFPQGQNAPAGARRWVDSSSVYLVNQAGALVRPLGKMPAAVLLAGEKHPTMLSLGPIALHASTDRAFYVGFPDQYAVRVYDADWKLQRIIRRAWTPRKLTSADLDAYVDGWMAMWSTKTGAERAAERTAMRGETYPDTIPAYSDIIVARTGELWVRESDLTGAPGCWCFAGLSTVPSKWSVFDTDGRWLGDVSMPARFIPAEIGADYVLGRSRDQNNVPRALMYRLVKK